MYCIGTTVPCSELQLSESDPSNFGSHLTTQPARVTLRDPDVVKSFNQEEFTGFITTPPHHHHAH